MISCIIVDDEPLAQEVLESYIARHEQLELVGKCNNAPAAFDLIHQQKVDLVFLDIKMPGISGITFVRSLKDPPRIIFTTAYSEHAVTGFELDAVDYLLKPVTYELFERSIAKLLRLHTPEPKAEKEYTYFKVSGSLVKIQHSELLFAQSVKDYVLLQTATKRYLTHMTMKHLCELLPPQTFVRVHRSYIVNLQKITAIKKAQLEIGEEVIPLGDLYKGSLEKSSVWRS
ncbi:MAG: LytTR family DNA-binding domain-containing protein [Bacteroidota bacterium]